jgi:hypothetical protein
MRYKYFPRCFPLRRDHFGNAVLAAHTAASTSAFEADAMSASFFSLEGLIVANHDRDFGDTNLPPMNSLFFSLIVTGVFSGAGL